MSYIRFKKINKMFGSNHVLKDIDLEVEKGQLVTLLGPSGCGKSTLLRCLAGLEQVTSGRIFLDGEDITDVIPRKRGIGMVFQQYSLFPNMNVRENVSYGLKLKKLPKAEISQKVEQMLEIVGLSEKIAQYPAQLSGGQQQRIAIARALATNPKVLLCDEATSALDPKTTHSILDLIREINRTMGITVIVITHQMSVVQEICNRVAILENGTVVEEGDVSQIFSNPKARATKALVFPDVAEGMDDYKPANQQTVRLVFQGAEATAKPLITSMAIDCRIAANILSATTRTLDGKIYGNMLLSIPGGPDELATAVKYLSKEPSVTVQVDVEYTSQGKGTAEEVSVNE